MMQFERETRRALVNHVRSWRFILTQTGKYARMLSRGLQCYDLLLGRMTLQQGRVGWKQEDQWEGVAAIRMRAEKV